MSQPSHSSAEAVNASIRSVVRGGRRCFMRRTIRPFRAGRIDSATFLDRLGFLRKKAGIEHVSIPLFSGRPVGPMAATQRKGVVTAALLSRERVVCEKSCATAHT